MASITTNTSRDSVLARFGASIMAFFVRVAEENPKYKEAQRLNAMSDEQLARLGMSRSDIPSRVWGARFI